MTKNTKEKVVTLTLNFITVMRLERMQSQKKSKKINFRLDGVSTPCYIETVPHGSATDTKTMSPRQRDKDKRNLHLYLPVELYVAFRRKAQQMGTTMSDLLTLFIINETKNTKLTEEDYEEIYNFQNRKNK